MNYIGNKGIKDVVTPNKSFHSLITAYSLIIDIDRRKVNSLFPFNGIVRPQTCFKSLMLIANSPGICNTALRLKTSNQEVRGATARLLELGYVDQVSKPRYIPCFNKHKLTTGYVINTLGLKVLGELLPVYDPLSQTA